MTAGTNVVINSPGVFLGIWAATGLPSFVLSAAAAYETGLVDRASIQAAVDQRRFDLIGALGVVGIAGWLLTQFQTAAVIIASSEGLGGNEPSVGAALKRAVGRFPAVIWTQLVIAARVVVLPVGCLLALLFVLRGQLGGMGTIVVMGILWTIAVGVMIALVIRYGFAQFVAVLDGESGSDAARRSRDLIVPNMGKVVGNAAVLLLIVIFVALMIGLTGGIAQVFAKHAAGDVASYAVQAVVRGIISLISAWMLVALTALFTPLSARTPRSA